MSGFRAGGGERSLSASGSVRRGQIGLGLRGRVLVVFDYPHGEAAFGHIGLSADIEGRGSFPVAGLERALGLAEIVERCHRLAVYADDHIALLDADSGGDGVFDEEAGANGANCPAYPILNGVNRKENWRGQTALMWAAAEGHAPLVELLVEFGADFRLRSNGGFTPLLFAVREGRSGRV